MQVSALSAQGGGGGGGRADRRVTLGQIMDEDLGMHGEAAWVAVSSWFILLLTCRCSADKVIARMM